MARTKFDICNNALVVIGAKSITDFEGGTTESAVASIVWTSTTENLIALYPWRFASRQEQLSRLEDAPLATWAAAYEEPSGLMLLENVHIAGTSILFDRFDGRIYCDAGTADAVIAEGTFAVDCEYWPPYFVTLVELELAQRFALALPNNLKLAGNYVELVERQWRLAKNADSRQQTARRIPVTGRGTIMEARKA